MKLKKADSHAIRILYQLMYDVQRLFEKEGIFSFVEGGTLLGTIRHKGIIPWDDDLDICVFKSDKKRIQECEPKLNKLGYGLLKVYFGYKIFPFSEPFTKGKKYTYPNLDIFFVEIIKTKIVYADKHSRREWPRGYHKISDLLPLRKYKFGNFKVWGPKNPKPFFKRMYGNNWNSVAYREYDHKNEQLVDKIKIRLTEKDRVPAKPYSQVVLW
jgi:lipopolysaccharide cholinephosphotransferase